MKVEVVITVSNVFNGTTDRLRMDLDAARELRDWLLDEPSVTLLDAPAPKRKPAKK